MIVFRSSQPVVRVGDSLAYPVTQQRLGRIVDDGGKGTVVVEEQHQFPVMQNGLFFFRAYDTRESDASTEGAYKSERCDYFVYLKQTIFA